MISDQDEKNMYGTPVHLLYTHEKRIRQRLLYTRLKSSRMHANHKTRHEHNPATRQTSTPNLVARCAARTGNHTPQWV